MRTGIASFFFCKVSFMKHPNAGADADDVDGDDVIVKIRVIPNYVLTWLIERTLKKLPAWAAAVRCSRS